MEYSLIILLLPLFMFLLLGLCGHKMSHRTAGLLGTTGLFIVTALAYTVAFQYFTLPRVDGVYQTLIPFNIEWLHFTEHLHISLGILLDPISVMMLVVITTVSLMVHLYSIAIQLFDVRSGCGDQYFSNVYFLGVGGCFFLLADRILLYKSVSGFCI